ncbi:MAG: sulfatase-like hydrolase/transferase [Halobacteriaceae archaeon]
MSDTRPNVVVAITDTQGWQAVGCGEGFVETPRIDELAAEGVRCDEAHITSPVCTPSRAGFFTGRYPHNVGAFANNVPLFDTARTMGDYFAAAGYDVGYVGKWHLDGTDYFGTGNAPDPYPQEYWYDGRNYLEDIEPEERRWWRDAMSERVATYDPEEMHARGVTREDTWAGGVTDRARRFIAEAEEPYFLVVSYDEPHSPSMCPPPFCDMYEGEPYPLPDNYERPDEMGDKPTGHVESARQYHAGDAHIDSISGAREQGGIRRDLYFGCVSFVDDEIGRVVDAAAEGGRETVTVFTSDHGHHLGAHGLDGKGGTAYDEVCRVPLVFHAPDSLPAGEVRDGVAAHVDVLPTLLDLAGAERPPILDGRSMRPLLADGEAHREMALVEYHGFSGGGAGFTPIRAAVTPERKLVVNLFDTDELYDRGADPGELQNRIDDPAYADERDALHDALVEEMARTRDLFHAPAWKDRPWRADAELTEAQRSSPDRPDDGFLPPSGDSLIPE